MSTIGKIFLLFNLFLAGGFLFWASGMLSKGKEVSTQLQDEKSAHEKTRGELDAKSSELNAQLTAEKGQKETFRNERDQAVSESSRNKEDLAASKRANDQLGGDVAKIQSTMGQYQSTNDRLTKEKDAAIAQAHEAATQRDEAKRAAEAAEEARRTSEESLVKAQRDIADLERTLKSSKDEIAQRDIELQNLVAVTGVARGSIQPQAAIDAKVIQVDMTLKPGLVALSAGSNAGVKKGYTFEIYNGSTYKGQVRVETVHPDMSSALIVFAKHPIGAGDSASTQL